MDLSSLPIVDHHAHPLHRPEAVADPVDFLRRFTESTDPRMHALHVPQGLFFRTALRWLAERIGCEATLDAYLAARAARPQAAWTRELLEDTGIAVVMCDYGYGGPFAYGHEDMKALLHCRVEPILRLETLAEELIVRHDTFDRMRDGFVAAVGRARADGYAALKSILAYRSGLAWTPVSPADARAAFHPLRETASRTGKVRLESKPLGDHLLGLALDEAARQGLPVQFHTGFGDRDADLRLANPLRMRPLIERAECPVVLLHAGWPYYREAAHLAALYATVWLDLSLAVPLATAGIPTMMRDVLGMAPLGKIMAATDAHTVPELFWLGARWTRWGLGRVLDEFTADGLLDFREAERTARDILGETARRLYGL